MDGLLAGITWKIGFCNDDESIFTGGFLLAIKYEGTVHEI